jgi:hypothetical protein
VNVDDAKALFSISIDRQLITETDAGTFNLEIEVSDNSEKQDYSIPVNIGYTFVKKPEEPKPADSASSTATSSTATSDR